MSRHIFIFGMLGVVLVAALTGQQGPAFPYLYIATIAAVFAAAQPFLSRLLSPVRDALLVPRRWLGVPVVPWNILSNGAMLVAFVTFSALMFPHQAAGDRPIDHDHPVHFFKIWQLREMLSHGQLYGWSHQWFAGYAPNYLYPIGTDLMVLLVWAMGFGQWALDHAYAWTFVLFWAMQGFGTYLAGRALVNPWAGAIAGVLAMMDNGAFRFGGWVFAGQWGVWPNSFAIAIGMIAVSYLPRVMQGKDRRAVAMFALWMGLSLLTHPLQMVHLGVIVVVAVVALLSSAPKGSRVLGVVRLGLATVLSAGISALWVLPFLSTRNQSENLGEPWRNAYDMGNQLYYGKLLEGSWYLAVMLAFVGTVALIRSRRFGPSFVGLMTLLCVAGASLWFTTSFHLARVSDAFSFLQYQRFAIIVKPYAFIAAGSAIVGAFQLTRSGHSAFRTFIAVLMGVPILFGWVDSLRQHQLDRGFSEASQRPYLQARNDLAVWLNDAWTKREVPFYRVETRFARHDHSFVDFGTQIPMPIYKSGYTPAETLRFKPESSSTAVLDALNVRYVISARKLAGPYVLVKDFGQALQLYEYKGWKREPFVITGTGKVAIKEWSNERIVLEADKAATGFLRLNVTKFSRWHAERDGQPVYISAETIPEEREHTAFMKVPLQPGTYVFEFKRDRPETLGLLIFLLSFGLCGLLWVSQIRPRGLGIFEVPLLHLEGSLEDADNHGQADALLALIMVAGVGALVALAAWTPKIQGFSGVREVRYDFAENVDRAVVARGSKVCPQWLGRHLCTTEEWGQVYTTSVEFGGKLKECVWAHPYKAAPLKLSYRHVPAGRLVGWYGIADTGASDQAVDVLWQVNGKTVHEGKTLKDGKTASWMAEVPSNATVDLVLKTTDQGTRHFCFSTQIVNEDVSLEQQ